MTKRIFSWALSAIVAAGLLSAPAAAIEIAEQRGDFYYDSAGQLVGLRNAELPDELRRPMSHREKFELMGIRLPEHRGVLAERSVAPKPETVPVYDGLMLDHLIVKFTEAEPVRLRQGSLSVRGTRLSQWHAILADFPAVTVERGFSTEERILDENKASGERISGQALADLNNYYLVRFPTADTGNADLANRILALDNVETAYFQGIDSDPVCSDITPTTPFWEANETYLDPAPAGIDAEFAWAYDAGGDGYGTGYWIMDLERTWCVDHEDLDFDADDIVNGETNGWYSDHGTAVLGIIGACDNGYGMTGITPDVALKAADHNSESTYAANIAVADAWLVAGEIMVLETQIGGPDTGTTCPCNCDDFEVVPLEWDQGSFDAIQTATANGIIVCEAAGNGSVDLDNAAYGNKFQLWFRDSGAIMVGASQVDHDPSCFTNHGNRLDVHAYGESVYSTGYGNLWNQAGCDQDYTSSFSGTSSATPQAVGACSALQGIAKNKYGVTLTPAQMRTLIKVGGTPQGLPAANLIGPMPDLESAISALEPDVTPGTPTGWSYAVVPRSINNSSWGSVPLQSAALPGNTAITYWNWAWHNISTYSPTLNSPATLLRRNDTGIWQAGAQLAAGGWAWGGNTGGPDVVKGGRHTIVSMADYYGVEDESSETNNVYSRQFIWSPLVLGQDAPVYRTDDPPATSEYWGPYYNAEGVAGTTGTPYWYAYAVMPTSASNTFDMRLNTEVPTNIPQAGFGANVAWSSDGDGEINFAIVDRNEAGGGTYYGSILNWTGAGAADKVVEFDGDNGTLSGIGTHGPFTLGSGNLIELHEFFMEALTGEYRIHIEVVSGSADFGLSVYDTEGGFFAKANTLAGGFADNAGSYEDEFAVVTPPTSGYYGMAVWKTNSTQLNSTVTYNVILSQDPNLTDATPAGWYGPVVPRNTVDATTTYAPLPDSLLGNQTTTSYNFSTYNEGANDAVSPWRTNLYVDDVSQWYGPGSAIGAGVFRQWTNTSQGFDPNSLVRGGRHHLRLQADALGELTELFETDNEYTDWFVWTPMELAYGVPILRDAPPQRDPLGYGPYYSTDGYRAIRSSAFWMGVATIPTVATDDYDLRLYDVSGGSKDGFGASLAWSSAIPGAVDFALVNFNQTVTAPYDFGVLNYNGGGNEVVIERSDEHVSHYFAPGTTWLGPYPIGSNEIFDILEVGIPPEAVGIPVHISLDNISGGANLGIALYDQFPSTFDRFDYTAEADAGGDGEDEHLAPITFANTGWYGLVVFKNGTSDLAKSAEYRVVVSTDVVVDAPMIAPPPATFALAPPRPNPFRGQTEFRYDVPVDATRVVVSIHDLAGRRIASLVDGTQPAGRHTASWNGRNEAGHRVASGIYFVRMRSGDFQQTRKVTILQ